MVQETPLGLFIILFLHQTTTLFVHFGTHHGCLSSCSYIKPQPSQRAILGSLCCLSSCSYIKPQRSGSTKPQYPLFIILFLHQTTTVIGIGTSWPTLFIILFLHQTTTVPDCCWWCAWLFIILFLHQTTTEIATEKSTISCLSSCSYIKPQRRGVYVEHDTVVYHLVPTSNHNCVN